MTQEEKQILSTELCARLMHRVKCFVPVENCTMELTGKRLNYFCFHKEEWGYDYSREFEVVLDPLNDAHNGYIIKPYLRPMSSMTEEEKKDWRGKILMSPKIVFSDKMDALYDFCNAHHLDYRGLIEKGLAIEAPEGMYNLNGNK